MLVLTRKEDQSLVFPGCGIVVHVLSVKGRTIKIGVEAPKSIEVFRGELMADSASKSRPIDASAADGRSLESMTKQVDELKNRLSNVTHAIQMYKDLRQIGKEEAANKTLDSLLASLAETDRARPNFDISLMRDCHTAEPAAKLNCL